MFQEFSRNLAQSISRVVFSFSFKTLRKIWKHWKHLWKPLKHHNLASGRNGNTNGNSFRNGNILRADPSQDRSGKELTCSTGSIGIAACINSNGVQYDEQIHDDKTGGDRVGSVRSEERRVGKECRS